MIETICILLTWLPGAGTHIVLMAGIGMDRPILDLSLSGVRSHEELQLTSLPRFSTMLKVMGIHDDFRSLAETQVESP